MQIATTDTWANHASGKNFANSGKSGDSWDDAYEITSAGDLAQIVLDVKGGNSFSGKYFKQMANIDLGAYQWQPPARYSSETMFRGNYDGQNFPIDGLKSMSDERGGIFGLTYGSSKITFKNIYIRSGYVRYGGIAGMVSYADILNCRNDAIIIGGQHVGGIVGELSHGTIKNCINTGSIKSSSTGQSLVGGIVGGLNGTFGTDDTYMENCINEGDVFTRGGWIGGLTATLSCARISNCVNKGNVYAENQDVSSSSYNKYIGGLVGECYSASTIMNCAFYGHIQIDNTISLNGFGALAGVHLSNTAAISITACLFYGTSNIELDFHSRGNDGSSFDYNVAMTACWMHCNGSTQISEAVSSTWTQYWAVVPNMNYGLPIQKELYSVAETANSTAEEIAAALPNAQVYA